MNNLLRVRSFFNHRKPFYFCGSKNHPKIKVVTTEIRTPFNTHWFSHLKNCAVFVYSVRFFVGPDTLKKADEYIDVKMLGVQLYVDLGVPSF